MNIAINGFGRIGRIVFRIAFDAGLNIVAVNDVHGAKDAAYLLKHDSVYGEYRRKIVQEGKNLSIGKHKIKILSEREPGKLPWKKLGVDVVIEATGAFREPKDAKKHLRAGAKYVIVTAPLKKGKADVTLVPGVNSDKLKEKDKLISIASCTTNCLAPMVKILNEKFGIERAFMTTVHAYTSSQALVDGGARKPARGRAAGLNIVPTTTGATKTVVEVLPEMRGKIDGIALRVPVASGSITELVVKVKRKASVASVNSEFKKAARGKMMGILEYNEEPLVSSDIIGNSSSAVFNALQTGVNGDLVRVFAWYDNEWGYSARVVDILKVLEKWC